MEAKLKVFLDQAPTIQLKEGVAHVLDNSPAASIDRAMSIRNLEKYRDRVNLALERYAKGDTDIIVDD